MSSLDDDGSVIEVQWWDPQEFADRIRQLESSRPRWIWSDTRRWYPGLLAERVRVSSCIDLRLTHPLALAAEDPDVPAVNRDLWSGLTVEPMELDAFNTALFTLDAMESGRDEPPEDAWEMDVLGEWQRQLQALAHSSQRRRRGLLMAAESTGALIAAELEYSGMPWDEQAHHEVLTEILGEVPREGGRPAKMSALLGQVADALDDPQVNPDSPVDLLKRLRQAGVNVRSTSRWELRDVKHPVIQPLLEYKKLSRLLTSFGWRWAKEWVAGGRFRPRFVVGGVVTGRWATDGGGALQIPASVRGAVRADPGWKLVVADAAQLEPRVLAAMSADAEMLQAATDHDLYQGMVDLGVVHTREQAKYGILGALYGGTTGLSGVMKPRMTKAFPRAMGMVEIAARRGEHNLPVSTWLGRRSPRPVAAPGSDGDVSDAAQRAKESRLRAAGRFTRNYIVQGTAAEWAMTWMALIRKQLHELDADVWLGEAPHLCYFLHDEVMVHAPAEYAETVAEIISKCAQQAGDVLFHDSRAQFPVTVAVVDSYGEAK